MMLMMLALWGLRGPPGSRQSTPNDGHTQRIVVCGRCVARGDSNYLVPLRA